MSIIFKLTHGDITRRITFAGQPTWAGLATKVAAIFALPESDIGVSYVDFENEEITLSSDEELQDFYLSAHQPGESIKFTVRSLSASRFNHDEPTPRGLPQRPSAEGPHFQSGLPLVLPPMGQPLTPFGLAHPAFMLMHGVPPALPLFLHYDGPPCEPHRYRGPHSSPGSPRHPLHVLHNAPGGQSLPQPTPPFGGPHGLVPPFFWPAAPAPPFGPHSHPPGLPREHPPSPNPPSPCIPRMVGEHLHRAFPGPHHRRGHHHFHGAPPGCPRYSDGSLDNSHHNHASAQGHHHWARVPSPDSQGAASSPRSEHHENSRSFHH